MKEQDISIVQLFRGLHDTHKIYFLLSLYDIYQHNDKYREDLSKIIEGNLHSTNPFLSGFSVVIANRLDIKNFLLEKEYFENLLNLEEVKGSSPFLTFINGDAIDGTYGKTVTNRIP